MALLVFFFAFFVLYLPHIHYFGDAVDFKTFDNVPSKFYPYPLHGDEWAHLAISEYLSDTGSFPNTNPIIGIPKNNPQSGFHFLLASIFEISKINFLYFYQFLAPFFGGLTALILFSILSSKYNIFAGLYAGLFYPLIHSNVNILGPLFFVPHTFSMLLLAFFLFFYIKDIKSLYILAFIISLIAYPLLSVILTYIMLITMLRHNKNTLGIFFMILASLIITFIFIYGFSLADFLNIIINNADWTGDYAYKYLLQDMLSPIILTLSIPGFFLALKEKDYVLLSLLIPIINILIFQFFNFSLVIPYQRALIYLMFGLVIFAGIGLDFVNKKLLDTKKMFTVIVFIFIFISSFFVLYEVPDERFNLIYLTDKNTIEVFQSFEAKYGKNNLVLTDPLESFTVYPLSKNNLALFPLSNLEHGNFLEAEYFFVTDCNYKSQFVDKYNIEYIITKYYFDCGFEFEKINNYFIYNVY